MPNKRAELVVGEILTEFALNPSDLGIIVTTVLFKEIPRVQKEIFAETIAAAAEVCESRGHPELAEAIRSIKKPSPAASNTCSASCPAEDDIAVIANRSSLNRSNVRATETSNICADCGTTLTAEELAEGCCGHAPARRYYTEFEPGPECVGPDTD